MNLQYISQINWKLYIYNLVCFLPFYLKTIIFLREKFLWSSWNGYEVDEMWLRIGLNYYCWVSTLSQICLSIVFRGMKFLTTMADLKTPVRGLHPPSEFNVKPNLCSTFEDWTTLDTMDHVSLKRRWQSAKEFRRPSLCFRAFISYPSRGSNWESSCWSYWFVCQCFHSYENYDY